MTEADDFSPEDVFKLFATAFPIHPQFEDPTTEATQATVTVTSPVTGPGMGPNGTWIFGQEEDSILLPILLVIIGFCALISNGIVLFVIIVFRRMRSGPNLMLLNIALSDLVFMLFCIPTAVANHAYSGLGLTAVVDGPEVAIGPPPGALEEEEEVDDFLPGGAVCKAVHYIIFVTVYVSIYSLVVACVFRFFSEYMPSSSKNGSLLSRTNAIISAAVIWVAFLISHLNFVAQPGGAIFQEPFICLHSELLASDSAKARTLWVTFLSCAFLLPLLTICTLSAVILHHQNRSHPRMHRRSHHGRGGAATGPAAHAHAQTQTHSPNYEAVQNYINERRNKREITMVIMAAMVVRAICWLPIQIFVMVDIFGMTYISEIYRKAEMIGVCCAFAGTCVNALLYNCLSTDFRYAFHEAFRRMGCGCCIPDKPEDDYSDMNETIMSIISESSNHINYT